MATVPLYTLVLRNGVLVNFQSNNCEIKQDANGNPVVKASAKEKGLSLMYSRSEQIDAIIKDTSDEPAYE